MSRSLYVCVGVCAFVCEWRLGVGLWVCLRVRLPVFLRLCRFVQPLFAVVQE